MLSASAVGEALAATRTLLDAATPDYLIVGAIALARHGYLCTTEHIDVLVRPAAVAEVARLAPSHDFTVDSRTRLRHSQSGVRLDLLLAGENNPRGVSYPVPDARLASDTDAHVISLPGLLDLKLSARRHQDLADVVALLKQVDDQRYIELESRVAPSVRAQLADLRRDALEELAFDRTT
jgi:hypothetical protein